MTHRRNRLSGTLLLAAATVAYGRTHAAPPPETAPDREPTTEWRDRGPEPTVLDIETRTCDNEDFRRALWTGGNLQLTVMSIPIGGEVGLERHADIDNFSRIEGGRGPKSEWATAPTGSTSYARHRPTTRSSYRPANGTTS